MSSVLCSAVVEQVLKPAAQGLPHLEKAERDAVLAAVAVSLPTALALFEHWLSLAPEVTMLFITKSGQHGSALLHCMRRHVQSLFTQVQIPCKQPICDSVSRQSPSKRTRVLLCRVLVQRCGSAAAWAICQRSRCWGLCSLGAVMQRRWRP